MYGFFSQHDVQLVQELHRNIDQALTHVADANINVVCSAAVGNQLGVLIGASKLDSNEMVDVKHKEG